MLGQDRNPDLGTASTSSAFLLMTMCILIGFISIYIIAMRTKVPIRVGYITFIWFLGVGVAGVLLFGPLGIPSDAGYYDRQAMTLASEWGAGFIVGSKAELYEGKEGYSILLGALYALGGRLPLAGIAINCALVGMSAVIMAWAAKTAYGYVNYRLLMAMFLFSPVYLTMGTIPLREALCWFGIAVIVAASVDIKNSPLKGLAIGGAGLGILYWTREKLFILMLLALIVALAAVVAKMRFGTQGIMMLGLLLVLLFARLYDTLVALSGRDQTAIGFARDDLSGSAVSGFIVWTGPLSRMGGIGDTVATLPHIFFGPFPWMLSMEPVWVWVFASSVMWWGLLLFLASQFRSKPVDNVTLFLLVASVVLLIGFGATLTNYGIVVRMRALPTILLVVVAVGQEVKWGTSTMPKHQNQHSRPAMARLR